MIRLIPPIDYLDFVNYTSRSSAIFFGFFVLMTTMGPP